MKTTLARDVHGTPVEILPYRPDLYENLDGMLESVTNSPSIYENLLQLNSWGGDNWVMRSTDGVVLTGAGIPEVNATYTFGHPEGWDAELEAYIAEGYLIFYQGAGGWWLTTTEDILTPLYANPSQSARIPLENWVTTGFGVPNAPTMVTTIVDAVVGVGQRIGAGDTLLVRMDIGEVISTIAGKINIVPAED
jgi:hypothetical protein